MNTEQTSKNIYIYISLFIKIGGKHLRYTNGKLRNKDGVLPSPVVLLINIACEKPGQKKKTFSPTVTQRKRNMSWEEMFNFILMFLNSL